MTNTYWNLRQNSRFQVSTGFNDKLIQTGKFTTIITNTKNQTNMSYILCRRFLSGLKRTSFHKNFLKFPGSCFPCNFAQIISNLLLSLFRIALIASPITLLCGPHNGGGFGGFNITKMCKYIKVKQKVLTSCHSQCYG